MCRNLKLGTNIKIWVPSRFFHNFLYFSQITYKWPWHYFPRLSIWFWKISKNLNGHLGAEVSNIQIKIHSSFTYNFLYSFSNGLQMAFATFPGAFKTFLRNLQKLKLGTLVPRWLTSKFGYLQVSLKISFIFLWWFTNGLATFPRSFKMIVRNIKKIEIKHLGAEVTSVKIWVPSSFSCNFLLFFSSGLQMALALLLI